MISNFIHRGFTICEDIIVYGASDFKVIYDRLMYVYTQVSLPKIIDSRRTTPHAQAVPARST